VAFEAEVYRRVLSHRPLSSARFYGAHTDFVGGGGTWLILEFLDGAVPASLSSPPADAVKRAADWAGAFHAGNAAPAAELADLLPRYDAGYYCQWSARAAVFVAAAAGWDVAVWFGAVRRCFERDAVPRLLEGPQTVIHGEFYPHNVLVTPGVRRVYPVDWESAAVGPGEIDLAALTDRWPEAFLTDCVAAYTCARWPGEKGAAPHGFQDRLDAARLYLQFRWLGNRSTWASARKVKRRLHDLQQLAVRLGMIA
jgi:aminoglycoside phosphotransferase (APT) family kinase protein